MGNSKVIFGGEVLIDLTTDTVTEDNLLLNKTAHGKDGELIVGKCTYDANTSNFNTNESAAASEDILVGASAYANGKKIVGEMPNIGAAKGEISTRDGKYAISRGYHDGSGTVEIDADERAKINPENIRLGVSILGVVGTMSGTEGEKKQIKSVTPTKAGFTVLPDDGYTCLTEVEIKPIPITYTANSAGGTTVTIA